MSNDFLLAIEITLLGMGLVFAALILLWGMMSLLTFITADRAASSAGRQSASLLSTAKSDSGESSPAMDHDLKAQVAAVAVVVALAEQQASLAHPLIDPPTAIVSAWQLGTRTRQLYEKRTPIVRKPRRIG